MRVLVPLTMMITQYCGCIQQWPLDDSEPRYVGVQHSDIPFNGEDMVIHEVGFNPLIHQKVQVFDEDGVKEDLVPGLESEPSTRSS